MQHHASQCLDAQMVDSCFYPLPHRSYDFNPTDPEPTVLVVDDDPDIAPLVNRALRPFDVYTEAVSEGADAIRRMRSRAYQLIVLDLGLDDVNGFDVLRALRELPANRNVPVLILTANGSHEAIARSFGHGADEFVKKPFDLRELGMRAFRLIRPFGK